MALPTPYSYKQEMGDGAKVDFTFTFDFIDQLHIYVYLDGALVGQGTAANEWQWDGPPTNKKIKMGTAPTTAQTLTIRRVTPQDVRIVQWADGSHLIADDLNTSDTQWLYLIQEHTDILNRVLNGSDPIPGPVPPPPFSFWNKYARHSDPNKGTANETAQTIDSVDQLAGDSIAPQNGVDAYVMTLGAISSRLDVIVGDGAGYPGAGNVGQQGKLRVDVSATPNRLYYWDTTATAWVEIRATTGTSATVDVGSTTTLAPGSNATVVNSGTTNAAILDFGIPKGEKGDPGPGIEYKGPINPTTTPPAGFSSGDFYVSTAAGTPVAQWVGLTTVAVNDRLIYNGNTSQWDRYSQAWIQSNWSEADSAAPAFIQNKPTLGTMASQDDAASDGKRYGRQNGAWTEITTAGGTNIGYTAAADKGTITSSTGTDATVPLADATNAGLFTAAEKTKLGNIADGAEVNVNADWNASSGDAQILNKPTLDFLPLAGGNMTGSVTATYRTVTAGAFDLSTGNLWQCGAIAVPNPTNAVAGMSGLIVLLGAPTGWGANFNWPAGTPPTVSTVPAVVPFAVLDSGTILMGAVTEAIS
jgi:hypothetical protein